MPRSVDKICHDIPETNYPQHPVSQYLSGKCCVYTSVGHSSESLTPTTDVLRASIYATRAARVAEDWKAVSWAGERMAFCGGLKMREVGLVEAILARA
jgi:hypothetical protein